MCLIKKKIQNFHYWNLYEEKKQKCKASQKVHKKKPQGEFSKPHFYFPHSTTQGDGHNVGGNGAKWKVIVNGNLINVDEKGMVKLNKKNDKWRDDWWLSLMEFFPF